MGTKLIVIQASSLLKLLTAYTDGVIPLDAKPLWMGPHSILQRYIGIGIDSDQWPIEDSITPGNPQDKGYAPLHIRFDGRKILKLTKPGQTPEWTETEPPKFKS